jgi:putative hydrolase of the HAD superfamily
LNIKFVWFDIGYTLLYMQREITYQKALREFGIDVPLEDIEKEFHLTDKLFMREYPGFFLQPRSIHARLPWHNELSDGIECEPVRT